MTDMQYQLVYNVLSFSLASMMASTIFFWSRIPGVHEKYKAALSITSLVTFIAAYHYFRIFNSWVDSYEYPKWNGTVANPTLTGKPFNDAYRYMDWLLTVPLLLIEIILVMDLDAKETVSKCWTLGVSSALMIILGYPGEMVLEKSKLGQRWVFWVLAMIPFLYIVYTLIIGLGAATNREANKAIRSRIKQAQWFTVISWLTYPIVYIIPMFGAGGADAMVGIQIGYCISGIISKCGVGFLIYTITNAKSKAMKQQGLIQDANYSA
jgi:bacteriorhodopsin